jgi:hypothetical protein
MYEAWRRWVDWRPAAGLRFSPTDAAAVAVCAAATCAAWPLAGSLALGLPIVLGHFFLFCNVFRVPRKPELVWAAAFVVNFGAWLFAGRFSWSAVLGTQLPVTLAIILAAILTRDYHGIGYKLTPWGRRPTGRDEA